MAEKQQWQEEAYEIKLQRMSKQIEQLERENKDMKERLDTISRALHGL